jgi:hypothetical protein
MALRDSTRDNTGHVDLNMVRGLPGILFGNVMTKVCIYVYIMLVCVCVCVHMYIYICIHTYIHTYTHTYIHRRKISARSAPQIWAMSGCLWCRPRTSRAPTASGMRARASGSAREASRAGCTCTWGTRLRGRRGDGSFGYIRSSSQKSAHSRSLSPLW